MHAVVEGGAQRLQLAVEGEPQVIGEVVADRLAAVVVHEGEDAAQNGDREQDERRLEQRFPGEFRRHRIAAEQPHRVVDRLSEKPRDRELEHRGAERRHDRDRKLQTVARGEADDAP